MIDLEPEEYNRNIVNLRGILDITKSGHNIEYDFSTMAGHIILTDGPTKDKIKVSCIGDIVPTVIALDKRRVSIMGYINERSYDSKCSNCRSPQKAYWTDVVICSIREL